MKAAKSSAKRSMKNEGEGSRTAARSYNKKATAFAKSGKVGKAAEKAKKALAGPEAASLKRAEKAGKAKKRG